MVKIDKLKVAAYCRVSTDKEDQINSLNNQRQYFTEYINKNDSWQLINIYYDEGVSGTSTKKRTGFNTMIADANANKIDIILTKEISRFARNTLDSLKYTRELKSIGVGVIFINDNINTLESDAELRLTIMSSIAQEESRKISERVKWGQKRRMEQGVVFGHTMLGYYIDNGKLEINHEEAETIKLIYHKFLHEEKGTHIIAHELKELGIKPKRSATWSSVIILRVLKNEKYVGDLLQKKSYTPDYLSHNRKLNKGNEEIVYIKNHHEPIIDREMWDKVQEELLRRSPSNETKSKYSSRYWCSGKIRCGECGCGFVSKTKQFKNGTIYKAWRCHAAAQHGTAKTDNFGNTIGCDTRAINNKVLLSCLEFIVNHILLNTEKIISDLIKDIECVLSLNIEKIDILKLQTAIEDINTKKKKAIDFSLDGIISREDLLLMNQQYNEEIVSIQRKIFEAENINKIQQSQIEGVNSYITEIQNIMNFTANNEILCRNLLNRIVAYKNNYLVIYLQCVPMGFKLHYNTAGRGRKFHAIVDSIKIIKEQYL